MFRSAILAPGLFGMGRPTSRRSSYDGTIFPHGSALPSCRDIVLGDGTRQCPAGFVARVAWDDSEIAEHFPPPPIHGQIHSFRI